MPPVCLLCTNRPQHRDPTLGVQGGVEDLLQRVSRSFSEMGTPLEFVFCVLPDKGNSSYLYPAIKRWAHTAGGLPSQCVLLSKLTDRQKYGMSCTARRIESGANALGLLVTVRTLRVCGQTFPICC